MNGERALPDRLRIQNRAPEESCTVDGCQRPVESKQMCQMHYCRHKRGYMTDEENRARRRKYPPFCTVDGCDRPHRSRGYCKNHWYRWRHHIALNQDVRGKRGKDEVRARDEHARKQCVRCLKWLDETAFGIREIAADGLTPYCAECTYDTNRYMRLKAQYGLTRPKFEKLLADQNGRCAICREPIDATTCHVDHDHACCEHHRNTCGGCVRGLLCPGCNSGIGVFRDSTDRLRAAIAYLESRQLKLPLSV